MEILFFAVLVIGTIFIFLLIASLETKGSMNKIARVLLILFIIGCLMACFVFNNWCLFFRDGFC